MPELVERIWDGPFDALMPNLTILHVGDTHLVTPEQAESGHWKDPNVTTAPAPAPAPASTFSLPATPNSPLTGEAD